MIDDKPKTKKLRTRSEARREAEAEAEGARPTAADRTVPIPGTDPDPVATCGECAMRVQRSACTVRATGEIECAECGAPIAKDAFVDRLPSEPAGAGAPREIAFKRPVFCDQCGAEWKIVDGKPWPNCGHAEGFVDEPQKAKRWSPPAGHPRPDPAVQPAPAGARPASVLHEAVAPAAKDAAIRLAAAPSTQPGHVRLEAAWGGTKFGELAGRYSSMEVGRFTVWADVPEGAIAESGKATLAELRKLADHAFDEQLAWYERKLGVLRKRSEGG